MTSRFTHAHIRRVLRQCRDADAGRILGVSRSRAGQLRAELDVPTPPKIDDRRLRVIRLLRQGQTATKVAWTVGLSASRVRRIRLEEGIPIRPAPVRCGTRSGYDRHLRLGEPACQPCLEANRVKPGQGRPENAARRVRVLTLLAEGRSPDIVAELTGMAKPWVVRLGRQEGIIE